MTIAIAVGGAILIAAAVIALRRRGAAPSREGPSAGRILFPFTGSDLSGAALDAAIRLARAENATLVPAYLARVPLNLPLASPLPRQSEVALPVLEAIEQKALRSGVEVEPRIERGRNDRHALSELIDHERYDRIVAPAAAGGFDGFTGEDVAWLLDHAEGEIVVFRPSGTTRVRRRQQAQPKTTNEAKGATQSSTSKTL